MSQNPAEKPLEPITNSNLSISCAISQLLAHMQAELSSDSHRIWISAIASADTIIVPFFYCQSRNTTIPPPNWAHVKPFTAPRYIKKSLR